MLYPLSYGANCRSLSHLARLMRIRSPYGCGASSSRWTVRRKDEAPQMRSVFFVKAILTLLNYPRLI